MTWQRAILAAVVSGAVAGASSIFVYEMFFELQDARSQPLDDLLEILSSYLYIIFFGMLPGALFGLMVLVPYAKWLRPEQLSLVVDVLFFSVLGTLNALPRHIIGQGFPDYDREPVDFGAVAVLFVIGGFAGIAPFRALLARPASPPLRGDP